MRDEGAAAENLARVLSAGRLAPDLLLRAPEAVALLGDGDGGRGGLEPRSRTHLEQEILAAVGRAGGASRPSRRRVGCGDVSCSVRRRWTSSPPTAPRSTRPSPTRARSSIWLRATRENATQSGISQHVAAVERALGVKLFERSANGVKPTPAGLRYYKRCVAAVGQLETAREEARDLAGRVTGDLRIGLMPTFTRAVLAPTLDDFVPRHPEVRLHIVEGYSGVLTEMVRAEELDFAVVPAFEGQIGLRSRLLVRDREMLLSGPRRGLTPLAPVRLKDCRPFKVVVPGPDNIRRRNLETYFHTHGVEIEAMLEMDAMIGTLEFVARSDWVTVLPSLISVNDIGARELVVNPIAEPSLYAEFVVIQPSRRTLSTQARRFLERFEAEIAHIHRLWGQAIAPKRARGGQPVRVRKVAAPR